MKLKYPGFKYNSKTILYIDDRGDHVNGKRFLDLYYAPHLAIAFIKSKEECEALINKHKDHTYNNYKEFWESVYKPDLQEGIE